MADSKEKLLERSRKMASDLKDLEVDLARAGEKDLAAVAKRAYREFLMPGIDSAANSQYYDRGDEPKPYNSSPSIELEPNLLASEDADEKARFDKAREDDAPRRSKANKQTRA